MAEVRRFRAGDDSKILDSSKPVRSKRPGDRAVTWLVVGFVCVAIIVLGFAIARSRTARPLETNDSAEKTAPRPGQGFRVARVLDGDTLIIVGQDNIELTLRLAGIDAPEKDQALGSDATTFLQHVLNEPIIHLDNVKRDKYGRVLAHAYIGSRWVNLEIVQKGWAWVYPPDSDSRVLREAEAKARSEKAGIWSSHSPTPPWEWRKEGQ